MSLFKFDTAFNGNAVRFSPFLEHRLAVATAENCEITGNGRQYVLELTSIGIVEVCSFDTSVGLYDCAFSEQKENVLISGSGDGSVKVWDIDIPPRGNPIRSLEEHSCAVYSVDWNTVRKDCFLSGSWDGTIKLWNLDMPESMQTFKEHSYNVFGCNIWNPLDSHVFASATGACQVSIWDIREPGHASLLIPHQREVLCCDWNYHEKTKLITGSLDASVKIWDIRFPQVHFKRIDAHRDAVLSVKYSPHKTNVFASCSCDMMAYVWEYRAPEAQLLHRWDYHVGFVPGIDLSKLVEGLLASTAWDQSVFVWDQGSH